MNRKFIYVASTAILVLEILAGAFMDLAHRPYVVKDVRSIGYPTYVLYIVGVWKVLAVGALLWPRLPRLREWAYAGLFFEMFGAFESHVLAADHLGRYAAPLAFTFLTQVSWCSNRIENRPEFGNRRTNPLGCIRRFEWAVGKIVNDSKVMYESGVTVRHEHMNLAREEGA